MPLLVVTNERDATGRLIEQLIVSQQEEDFIKQLSAKVFSEELAKEYRNMGLPHRIEDDQNERAGVFSTLVSLHKFKKWIIIAIGAVSLAALTALTTAIINHNIIVTVAK